MLAGVLAIALGSLLSPTRYYWAVIAAFVTFTGTGTRSETFLKGSARIVGTLAGLVAAVALAHVTAGHAVAIFATILVSIFLAFYLVKVSYAAMTFFITILLGQLYTVIGTFSDQLLELRLGETAVGAVVGVAGRDGLRAAVDPRHRALRPRRAAGGARGAARGRGGVRRRRARRPRRAHPCAGRPRPAGRARRPAADPAAGARHSPRRDPPPPRRSTSPPSPRRGRSSWPCSDDRCAPRATAAAARALADAVRALLPADVGEGAPAGRGPAAAQRRRRSSATPARRATRTRSIRHLHHLGATLTGLAARTSAGG